MFYLISLFFMRKKLIKVICDIHIWSSRTYRCYKFVYHCRKLI